MSSKPQHFEPPSAAKPGDSSGISLSEIVSALSFALDLTEAAVPGHAVRSCLFGMAIGRRLELPDGDLAALYYALLLKDIGCSGNASRMCQLIGGDDREMKREVKLVDWTRPSAAAVASLWRNAMPGATVWQRAGRILRLGMEQESNNRQMITLRCDRGASIIRKIGLGDQTAEAVRSLDEHWDGSGYPDRTRAQSIPLLARILSVAQHLDIFAVEFGLERAVETLRDRSGRWFDPELVRVACSLYREGAFSSFADPQEQQHQVMDMEPGRMRMTSTTDLDRICEAFADVVDAKSSFTYRHSLGVTRVAQAIAHGLDFPPEQQKMIYRAALLHDLGKLRVPNTILDKPGKLDSSEWAIVREHAGLSQQILTRIRSFRGLAVLAGRHHERLDGSGYPDGLSAEQLSMECRVIAVADVFGSLTETRPYRPSMPMEKAISILESDAPHRLDPECVAAVVRQIKSGALAVDAAADPIGSCSL